MQGSAEIYIKNMEQSLQLMKSAIRPEMSEDEILSVLRRDSARLYAIRCENDRILKELLFDRPVERLTQQDAVELAQLAHSLSYLSQALDPGVAYYIWRRLYEFAVLHGDEDGRIRALYFQGTSLFNLNMRIPQIGIDLFGQRVREYFDEAAACFAKYETFEKSDTRSYILRSMINRDLTIPHEVDENGRIEGASIEESYAAYSALFDENMSIVCSPHYRALNPELPWERWEYSMHLDRSKYLTLLRRKHTPRMGEDVLQSARYAYQWQLQQARGDETRILPRVRYLYAAARFHAGQLSAVELIDLLLALCAAADPQDFSVRGIFSNVNIPQTALDYARYLTAEQHAAYHPRLEAVRAASLQYILTMPRSEYSSQMLDVIRWDMMARTERGDAGPDFGLLDTILVCHVPTFVHSRMVAEITRGLAERMMEANPAAMAGVFGYGSAEEILANREAIAQRAWQCGLYHDVGKSMVLQYVGIYGRSLLDEEFLCIKYHPQQSYDILKAFPGMEDLAEAALRHHRSCDGTRGYPYTCPPCPARVRPIVDILPVADSIDAGTDDVGRCYAPAKSYDTLVGELFDRRGTSYAPEVVDLFLDEGFRAEFGERVRRKRREIYCEVYRDLARKK